MNKISIMRLHFWIMI
ncbi:hypothetical protein QN277_022406 [Acacia crassicarpa]|uniref:Uncharacterized protein n=1 Tax=Acacia crassicarpa TaxID=499986 RepID=A0AAE1JJ34_9FABA|nr:hypothetical protein QN277_022406 [Acacia crassicarpa]